MWIKNKETDIMASLTDCKKIVKDINEYESGIVYSISFEFIKDHHTMKFKSEEEMENFYSHLEDLIKPIIIDPKQKPIKL